MPLVRQCPICGGYHIPPLTIIEFEEWWPTHPCHLADLAEEEERDDAAR